MKKLLTLSLAASLSAFLFGSCSGDSVTPGGDPINPGELYSLTIEADKTMIAADSVDEATLTVKYKGEVVTEGIELYRNDTLITPINFKFRTDINNTYKFRAKRGADNSPSVTIVAKSLRVNPGVFVKKALTLYLTATNCSNCPTAMNLVKAAHKDYPGRIVTLAWHSVMKGAIYDPFGMQETQSIMTWLGGTALPMVNIDNSLALYPGSYDKHDYEKSLYDAPTAGLIGLAIESKLDGKTVTGTVRMKNSSKDLAKKAMKINVVVTEDGLVSNQLMPSGPPNSSYVHDHVVRHVFTPLTENGVQFGQAIPSDQTALDATYEYTFSYTIPAAGPDVPGEYNSANMNVAAFVSCDGVFIASQITKFGESVDFEYNKKQ